MKKKVAVVGYKDGTYLRPGLFREGIWGKHGARVNIKEKWRGKTILFGARPIPENARMLQGRKSKWGRRE